MRYFDYNATTPLAPEVAATFAEASSAFFGNASSIHRHGQQARQQLESSRKLISEFLGVRPADIVFTSGGTESNNLALFGLLRGLGGTGHHVISSTIEHPSAGEPLRALESQGANISYARAGSDGAVDLDGLASLLRPETVLVSIMHANNETGVLQPLGAIAELVKRRRALGQNIYLHSDGVQAFGKVPLNLQSSGIDLYSFSGHKIFGPKGIGGLYIRPGVPLAPLYLGGKQERSRRAGTENVPAVMALAKAVELCRDFRPFDCAHRDQFEDLLRGKLAPARFTINGVARSHSAGPQRLPNTSNIEFPGISGEALVISLDMKGFSVSTGSACSSGSIEPSHVLLAMGRTREQAKSCIRFSFSRYNSDADVQSLAAAVVEAVEQHNNRKERRSIGDVRTTEKHAVLS